MTAFPCTRLYRPHGCLSLSHTNLVTSPLRLYVLPAQGCWQTSPKSLPAQCFGSRPSGLQLFEEGFFLEPTPLSLDHLLWFFTEAEPSWPQLIKSAGCGPVQPVRDKALCFNGLTFWVGA